ncbi:MAG: DnaA/Hda family protein [Patescibacteria group bacterium]
MDGQTEISMTDVWGLVQAILRKSGKVDDHDLRNWFKNTEQISLTNGELVIGTPSEFFNGWLNKNYGQAIRGTFDEMQKIHGLLITSVSFRFSQRLAEKELTRNEATTPPPPIQTRIRLVDPVVKPKDITYDQYVVHPGNKRAYWFVRQTSGAPPCEMAPVIFIHGDAGSGKTALGLCAVNDYVARYAEAHSGKELVTRFVYMGDSGWYDEYQAKFSGMRTPDGKPLERREGKTGKLIKPYDANDFLGHVVLFDDINGIGGQKTSTHDACLGMLKVLTGKGPRRGQVIVTASCPPDKIRGFPPALVSILSSGFVLKISPPNLEASLRILQARMAYTMPNLTAESGALELIAQSVIAQNAGKGGDIRQLIGILAQVTMARGIDSDRPAQLQLFDEPPAPEPIKNLTVQMVRQELEHRGIDPYTPPVSMFRSGAKRTETITSVGAVSDKLLGIKRVKPLTHKDVVRVVERHFHKPGILNGSPKTAARQLARGLAFYACRFVLEMTEPETATAFVTEQSVVSRATWMIQLEIDKKDADTVSHITAIRKALLATS